MLLTILMVIFGMVALMKGEFKITARRKVKGETSRSLGTALIIGAILVIIPRYGGMLQLLVLVGVIILGLTSSEKIEAAPPAPPAPPQA